MSRNPETVRSRVVWGLVYLATYTTSIVLTGEPDNRVRDLSIFLPLGIAVFAVGQWFQARRDRRQREPEGPDYRLTRH